MQVALTELTAKMTGVLKSKGYNDEDIPFIIDMYLGGQLRGHTSHGLASFAGFVGQDFSQFDEPEVIKETHSLFLIDAKSRSGNVIGRRAADEAIKRAKEEAVGVSVIKNMETWLRPGAIAEYVAKQGLVALVFNSGGEASVAPPGGYDSVVGTNPISYGIPTGNGPLVVDMATSKRAKGQIRLANKYGTDLPPDSFYDKSGNITVDPKEAYSILPFGEYKGFALALFVEMLCGSLLGMPMMIAGDPSNRGYGGKTPLRGGFIMVVDPEQMSDGGLEGFKKSNADLLARINATSTLPGQKIRIPGEKAAAEEEHSLQSGSLDIPDELWEEINNI